MREVVLSWFSRCGLTPSLRFYQTASCNCEHPSLRSILSATCASISPYSFCRPARTSAPAPNHPGHRPPSMSISSVPMRHLAPHPSRAMCTVTCFSVRRQRSTKSLSIRWKCHCKRPLLMTPQSGHGTWPIATAHRVQRRPHDRSGLGPPGFRCTCDRIASAGC